MFLETKQNRKKMKRNIGGEPAYTIKCVCKLQPVSVISQDQQRKTMLMKKLVRLGAPGGKLRIGSGSGAAFLCWDRKNN